MEVIDLFKELNTEISLCNSPDFQIEFCETKFIPSDNDSNLTFEDFDKMSKKVKIIETCILFIDIRKSTTLNLKHKSEIMAKLYSSFIRSMLKAADLYNGYVRNIVGDRIMVSFDSEDCFEEAVNTAILMNTISQKIINKKFQKNIIKCGIGIDFGKMMVTKCGTIKQGKENTNYKSLVWVGNPANIASKLTDIAFKSSTSKTTSGVNVGLKNYFTEDIDWHFETIEEFIDNIKLSYTSSTMNYKDPSFRCCTTKSELSYNYDSTPPILITKAVYDGLKSNCPDHYSISKRKWKRVRRSIDKYYKKILGGNIFYEE